LWTNASITKMSRPAGITTLVITPEQAKAIEDNDFNNVRLAADQKPTDQTVGAPQRGPCRPMATTMPFGGTRAPRLPANFKSPR
jgi:hypothetical protein